MPSSVLPDESEKDKNPAKSVIDSPKPKGPPTLRAFGDAVATRKAIYDNVLHAAQNIGPVANVRHTLTLDNVKYADPEDVSLQKQKEAVLAGKSLSRRLRGTWRLRDNETGKLLDEQHLTVAQVPYQTNRGTFIMNGSDYILRHQMRLNPGVFTRIKENGELEAHVNVLPGKGVSQRYFLDPETGVFKINIGQAKLPLIPVLRAMGVTDKQLKEHWGPEILQANAAADDKRVIDKLYGRLVRRGDPAAEHPVKSQAVADVISKMELDPEVTERTLGFPHKNISPEAILATTNKLLRVSRGEADPDDRDHLAFQTLYGPEDLLAERFAKDKSYLRQLLWRATTKGNLAHIQPGALTKQLHAALLHSGLGQAAEEINPAELLDAQTSVTRLGEGGIPNMEAVPDESRSVQPSHFAFIDPIRTPECYDSLTEVMTKSGWKPWPEVSMADRFACFVRGGIEYHKPEQLYAAPYRGTMYGARSEVLDYLVTPNHRMYVRPCGPGPSEWRVELAETIHRQPRDFMCVHVTRMRHVITQRVRPEDYYTEEYDGYVYCATVPGGLLYVRRGTGCGHWSGNSFKVGIDTRIASAARKGSDGRIYSPFLDVRTGRKVYRSPQDLTNKIVAFPGELAKNSPYVAAQVGGTTRFVPREDADYELPHFENAFSPLGNMIPMKSAIKGQRMAMGSRYLAQALPLVHRESPHVQGAMPGTNGKVSFEEHFAEHLGAVRAKQPGRVTKITPDEITVKYGDGTTHKHELYNNFPYARKTFVHNEPVINVGDQVKPGQLLAKSNFTDDNGAAALGLNARIAFVPMAGANYEDAAVISEGMRKRLASEHMYQHDQEWTHRHAKGKRGYISLFPGVYDRKTLDNMDDKGVVKPGTEIKFGDPLILAAEARETTHSKVHRGRKASYADKTQTWEHHAPGVVTDVVHSGNNTTVAVKSINEIGVGDKLCYSPDTDVLTSKGWKPIGLVGPEDEVASLGLGDILEYVRPRAVQTFDHCDRMYALDTTQVSLLVTDNHKLYAKPRSVKTTNRFSLIEAGTLFGKRYKLKNNANWVGKDPEFIEFPGYVVACGQGGVAFKSTEPLRLTVPTYAMLLGVFLSEGSTFDQPDSGSYGIDISQTKSASRDLLEDVLNEAGLHFCKTSDRFRIYSKHLMLHFNRLGHSHAKFIPSEVFGWSAETLRTLYRWMMWGDGNESGTGHCYTTTSKQLADDFQRLCLHVGYAARVEFMPGGPRHVFGRDLVARDCYKLYVYRHKNEPTVNHGHIRKQNGQHERWEHYEGLVHCLSLPRNHVLYVRRNGKPVWCGNSNRYGGKGVVSMILPDDKMPHDAAGKPFELLLNPLGMISRINPAQIAEAVLGKIAAKTGKKYKVEDFGGVDDLIKFASDEAQKYGVKDKEPVFDPKTGRQIKDPFTGEDPLSGYQFMLKLHHQAEAKAQGRGTGAYTAEEVPAKGGSEGSKRIALLETNALLSHGSTEVLRDAHLIRGQKNDQYWQAYMSGFRPPEPQIPFVYRKYLHHLQAAGINPIREGGRMHIMALTDRDVDQMAGDREIQNADTVDWKEGLKPRKGGLFDPTLTGGHNGNRWSYIKLHEPLPNPAFEEPIRRLLGLTQNRLEGIIGGTEQINGQTGPKAVWNALDRIDVKKEIDRARTEIKGGRATARDAAVRRLGYLKTLNRLNMHPRDWIQTKVPVLPPAFRPVSVMAGSGTQLVSDPNYLYKEVLDANDVLKQLEGKVDDLSQERLNLYNAFKGVVGLGDPIQPKNQERRVQGVLKHVFGSSPKLGTVQRQLLGATVDVVGRAVITPNPDFDMDQVGLPEAKAWSVYQPFVIRRLVQKGVPRLEAVQAVKDKKEMARQAIIEEMRERPVIISRAPVLHKFGIQAFLPKLIKGDVMQISPLVTKGFNADFDGDMMNWHVPASEEAKREALLKMLPSRNLFSTSDFKVHYLPSQEYIGGLYAASVARDDAVKRPRVFATKKDAVAAYNRGEIDVQTPVEIIQH